MDTPARTASAPSLHPVLWVAALSITAFSAVGIAAMTGAFEHSSMPAPAPVVAAAASEAAAPGVDASEAAAPEATPSLVAATPAVAPPPAPKAAPPVVKTALPRKTAPAHHEAAHPVRVAQNTYDPGIDIIPATPREAGPAHAGDDGRAPLPVCPECGIVESIREVQAAADPSGLGAAAGGVVGGLLGNNVGKGSGRTIATIIGIAGGAYAGHQVEKTQRKTTRHEVGVRLNNGDYRTVTLDSAPVWQVGDRVKLQNGRLVYAE